MSNSHLARSVEHISPGRSAAILGEQFEVSQAEFWEAVRSVHKYWSRERE